jgi:hypothetical protein
MLQSVKLESQATPTVRGIASKAFEDGSEMRLGLKTDT